MSTTANKQKRKTNTFTPSVDIIRDAEFNLNYIPTPNAKLVFNQLINDYQVGLKSFNLVGAYGTGKSSFLWAFEKNINGQKEYFSKLPKAFTQLKNFTFIRFVGEYDSIIDTFAHYFGFKSKD